jgi:hypothetical protein
MQPKSILLTVLVSVLFGGCARRDFVPTEKVEAASPDGFAAAEYDLSTKDGDLGTARVWSSGAAEVDRQGGEETVLHVGFEVENASDEPLRLPAEGVRLESVRLDDGVLEGIPVTRIDGPQVIAAHESARIHASFVMPAGVEPEDMDDFRVRWELRSNGTVHTEWTPFVDSAYAYSPMYDPYYAGAFGPPIYGTVHGYPYYGYPYWY